MKNTSPRPHPFGEAISRMIAEKGLKKYRIAKRLGKQVSEITRLERQKGAPKWDTFFTIARGMDVDPRELFLKICDIVEEREKTPCQ